MVSKVLWTERHTHTNILLLLKQDYSQQSPDILTRYNIYFSAIETNPWALYGGQMQPAAAAQPAAATGGHGKKKKGRK